MDCCVSMDPISNKDLPPPERGMEVLFQRSQGQKHDQDLIIEIKIRLPTVEEIGRVQLEVRTGRAGRQVSACDSQSTKGSSGPDRRQGPVAATNRAKPRSSRTNTGGSCELYPHRPAPGSSCGYVSRYGLTLPF